ncbi:carbohydrate kinase family protein [Rubripirellula reticaptiva]|uniref:Ribokinase n=1 Tax=Rubripirellula reticaptiva TaxID=2528013 RepID=A0A5C6FBQ4_9BACT|nr:PfkB family carbohydrate kinase [Rubripirellula reticaptiva]TWU57997.1 Ribokinase [Rubripirellula reticaptiva]
MNSPSKSIEILGIGVSVLDVLMVVDELPTDESVVRAKDRRISLGGGVAVATATAAMMGGQVSFADRLGNDVASQTILAELKSAGVNVDHIEVVKEQSASVATVWVRQNSGSRTIVFSPGSDIPLSWNDELAAAVANAKILHCNGRHVETCLRAIEIAKRSDTLVSFDGGAHRYRDEVLPLVRASDILIVSEHFAAAHVNGDDVHGNSDPATLAEQLAADFDARIVGVTAGDRGSWFVCRNNGRWHEPAVNVDRVVDTTGCGDTFHGAFLYGIAKGFSVRRSSHLASIVAANNACGLGALAVDLNSIELKINRNTSSFSNH